jgi:hypothetical protein
MRHSELGGSLTVAVRICFPQSALRYLFAHHGSLNSRGVQHEESSSFNNDLVVSEKSFSQRYGQCCNFLRGLNYCEKKKRVH